MNATAYNIHVINHYAMCRNGAESYQTCPHGFDAQVLLQAAACGNLKILTMLEAAGGRVDMRNAAGMTPLAYSAAQGNVKALETLIAKGANLHTRNQDGTTPLHQAATCGNQVRLCTTTT